MLEDISLSALLFMEKGHAFIGSFSYSGCYMQKWYREMELSSVSPPTASVLEGASSVHHIGLYWSVFFDGCYDLQTILPMLPGTLLSQKLTGTQDSPSGLL